MRSFQPKVQLLQRLAWAACLLVAVPAICVGHADSLDEGHIVGRVMDTGGRPVGYANILICGSHDGAFARVDGLFTLRWASQEAESLRATAVGYYDTTIALRDISQGDTLRLVLRDRFDLRGNRDAAETLVHDIQAATRVEVFRISEQMNSSDDVPNIYHFPILSQHQSPSRRVIAELCHVVLEASRDTCGNGPTMCMFAPRYVFRFHDQERPLMLFASEDCLDLSWRRGGDYVASGAGGGYRCVATALREIMADTFSKGRQR